MHLESLGSDDSRFKRLDFHDGLNLVLADKTMDSDSTDSRNGAGKSSIVRLLRYLLGGNATPWTNMLKDYSDEEFWAVFSVAGSSHCVRRSAGSTEVAYDNETMGVTEWRLRVGTELLGFQRGHVRPTSGEIFGQLVRDQFDNPLKIDPHEKNQASGARVGFYLGVSEEALSKAAQAASFEANKKALSKAVKDGTIGGLGPDKAECRAGLVVLERDRSKLAERLTHFKVDESYSEHQRLADELSQEIARLNDKGVALRHRVGDLEAASKAAVESSSSGSEGQRIRRLYREAGMTLPDAVLATFQEVLDFHNSVARNRALFLEEELRDARADLKDNDAAVKRLDDKRASLLSLLNSTMALDAYSKAQADLTQLDMQIARLNDRISDFERLDDMDSNLKRMRLEAVDSMREELRDNDAAVEKMTSVFVSICEEIYSDRKGKLSFDVDKKGILKVTPKVEGDDSKGIKGADIFAFDLACVIVGSMNGVIPGFLVHDSHLFDAMDDRQLCSCLNIGARLSKEYGLQYIVLLNTDRLESAEEIGFDRGEYPISTVLTDRGENGGLFGARFG